ncbi:hypothetical protein PSEUBRA_004126 [Kalmanozyma brasiliensis GHG001]|uniref:Signal recognition particle subunit SRP68 n=1 Tax=Kalmanozyma brasiliensis (strain GHG001) TaxID=1365824 RepID=V5ET92_KALBG|nr:uncharacterized protein PSEUBRA_004126 [Kalmanozyma brasiliensis GHG001]EST06243.1 hypothetical protein PSEUBRA_004126 [Kalmanozyma brasiliensis GHG001]
MEIDFANREQASEAGGEPIAFPLLQLISEARNEHGLRQQDYARYRRYCASKVHRLRELLSVTHADASHKADGKKSKGAKGPRGKKPKKAQQAAAQRADAKGHGNVFTAKKLDVAQVADARPAHLLLFEAERAWAYSQELRNDAFDEEADPQLRKRGISRHRRAEQWSESLHKLIQALSARFDVYSRAETAAYLLITKATTAFDRSQWEKALELLSASRKLLNTIATNSPTSRAEALANSFVDAGEAQMRYSAYQLGDSEQDMDKIATSIATTEVCQKVLPEYAQLEQELASAKAKAGGGQKQALSLSWHRHEIPVRNPELLDTIVAAQAEEAALRDSVMVEAVSDRDADARAAAQRKAAPAKKEEGKRVRLSHAQRKAKKREIAQGESSADGARNATTSTARLGKGGRTELDPFDRALSAFTDAEDVARKLVEDNAEALAKSHSARYETASKDLQTAHDFIFYRLLALRVWRNLRLVAEVERRAEKREKRAMSSVEARLKGKDSRSAGSVTSKRSKRSKGKQQKLDEKIAHKKANPHKNPPGSRAKMPRTGGRSHARKPARSGTRKLRTRQALARENRARAIAAQKSKRRGARAVPSLARLLDAAETSLVAMGSIALIESEPDVSSLVEAKAAWFRSEILRHLARAFSLSGAHAEAVLLLTRAQLYIRQARQAADLAEDVEEEDADFPPRLKSSGGSDAVFDHSDEVLARLKRGVQKSLLKAQRQDKGKQGKGKAGSAMSDSRAGQALKELARKYIDFDPVSLQEAERVPEDVKAEYEQEQQAGYTPVAAKPQAKTVKAPAKAKEAARVQPAAAKKAEPVQQADDEAEHFEDDEVDEDDEDEEEEGEFSMAYDPGNEEDEEDEAAEAAAQKKGWLGGWFGRK